MDSLLTRAHPASPLCDYPRIDLLGGLLPDPSPPRSSPDESPLFSVQAAPDSPSSSDASKDDFLLKFHYNNRYFEDPNPLIRCFNCGLFGHMANACSSPSTKVRCVYCGDLGHTAFNCEEVICHACRGVGHKFNGCPYRRQQVDRCRVCDRAGHRSRDCLARAHPLEESEAERARCLHCGHRRHCNCFFPQSYSKSLYCCRCGEKGHDLEDCRDRSRRSRRES